MRSRAATLLPCATIACATPGCEVETPRRRCVACGVLEGRCMKPKRTSSILRPLAGSLALVATLTNVAGARTADTCLRRATHDAWRDRPLVVTTEDGGTQSLERWSYVKRPLEGVTYASADSQAFLPASSVAHVSYVHRSGNPAASGVGGFLVGGILGAALGAAVDPPDPHVFMDFGGAPAGLLVGAVLGLLVGLGLGSHHEHPRALDCGDPSAAPVALEDTTRTRAVAP
jgi:hypothetical protein